MGHNEPCQNNHYHIISDFVRVARTRIIKFMRMIMISGIIHSKLLNYYVNEYYPLLLLETTESSPILLSLF